MRKGRGKQQLLNNNERREGEKEKNLVFASHADFPQKNARQQQFLNGSQKKQVEEKQ